jgi:hypothetical protein
MWRKLSHSAALLFSLTLPHTKHNGRQSEKKEAGRQRVRLAKLVEADVLSVLAEALTAHVQLVLADQSLLVRADHAAARALAHTDLLAGAPLVEMSHLD